MNRSFLKVSNSQLSSRHIFYINEDGYSKLAISRDQARSEGGR